MCFVLHGEVNQNFGVSHRSNSEIMRFKSVVTIHALQVQWNVHRTCIRSRHRTDLVGRRTVCRQRDIDSRLRSWWLSVTDCDHDDDVSVLCGKSSEQIGNFINMWLFSWLPKNYSRGCFSDDLIASHFKVNKKYVLWSVYLPNAKNPESKPVRVSKRMVYWR